ncbi:HSP18 transcriptional regulator [Amycolatopsis sp. EV170708-02-1]|uniref:HSP18 transcriptional regulator n=1 Tax=Amycolatopsis sp. EV170708-02-1 TaxID=2919322 RepID=UPI001F0B7AA4|nr:HSP18 transcriptional regulator [Amycolatopsis sp. EV170708-02-1]UMP00739.1 HSP18 transcriptional regulator [Amycolatopsis sp. EV170708-02-1]
MDEDPSRTVRAVRDVVAEARSGVTEPERLLAALAALREVREQLAAWEPELIAAARAGGTSWTALAPALGVASRQAAERRFLRLRPSVSGESTGEARVDAERDRRAGDRAVAEWARRNSAILRQLAGQAGALPGLDAEARESADRLSAVLGEDDVTGLLAPLADLRARLPREHTGFAERLGEIGMYTEQVRRDAVVDRRDRQSSR